MIVEEQGIDFRTGVRFPSAPLLGRPHNCWKIQCLCGFLILSECTKRKPKRLKKRLFSGQISHEVSHEKRAKKASKYTMSLTLAKSRNRKHLQNYDSCFLFVYGHTYPLLFVFVFFSSVRSFMGIRIFSC